MASRSHRAGRHRFRAPPRTGTDRWFRRYRFYVIAGWVLASVLVVALVLASLRTTPPLLPGPPAAITPPTAPAVILATPVADPPGLSAEAPPRAVTFERWRYVGFLKSTAGEVFSFHATASSGSAAGGKMVYRAALLQHGSGKQISEQVAVSGGGTGESANGFVLVTPGWRLSGESGRHSLSISGKEMALALILDDAASALELPALSVPALSGRLQQAVRPRMRAEGSVTVAGTSVSVSGEVWFDRQWGDLDLSAAQVATFSLLLDDGAALQLCLVEGQGGKPLLRSAVLLKDGGVMPLDETAIRVVAASTWRSPSSGVVYPMDWQLSLPGLGMNVRLQPVIRHSQFNARASGGNVFWLGAVSLAGSPGGVRLAYDETETRCETNNAAANPHAPAWPATARRPCRSCDQARP